MCFAVRFSIILRRRLTALTSRWLYNSRLFLGKPLTKIVIGDSLGVRMDMTVSPGAWTLTRSCANEGRKVREGCKGAGLCDLRQGKMRGVHELGRPAQLKVFDIATRAGHSLGTKNVIQMAS